MSVVFDVVLKDVVFGVVFKKIFKAMSEEISKFSKIPFILHLISLMIRNEDSPDGCYDDELSVEPQSGIV